MYKDTLDLPGFQDFDVYKAKAAKTVGPGRPSGGLLVLADKTLNSEIVIESLDYLFIKVRLESKPIIVGCVYLQPSLNPNILTELDNAIGNLEIQFPDMDIVVGGDFNSRIGFGNSIGPEEIEGYKVWDLRISKDSKSDPNGLKLINLMEEKAFLVLNGRTVSDRNGEITFVGPNGKSVIDLVWVSRCLLPYVDDFMVCSDVFPSDHFPCVLKLNLIEYTDDCSEEESEHGVEARLRWKPQAAEEYTMETAQGLLDVDKEDISSFHKKLVESIRHIGKKLGCEQALKFNKSKKLQQSNPKQPWFDGEFFHYVCACPLFETHRRSILNPRFSIDLATPDNLWEIFDITKLENVNALCSYVDKTCSHVQAES
ncbi:hypothetical protein M8J75_002833 [Diaphorina citri]|nr:hypothetical protein M8J75_002833 [Diaphorina citri]